MLYRLLLAAGVFAFALPAFSADHYVWCGATGASNGTEWTDAYPDLPASLARGDTYYVAGSTTCSYGYHLFNDPESGSTYTYITKATAANSGNVPGWQSAFGSAPAQWIVNPADASAWINPDGRYSVWFFETGYYVVDGVYGAGLMGSPDIPGTTSTLSTVGAQNYTSGYGFYLESWLDNFDAIVLDSLSPTANISNVTVQHTETNGVCIMANFLIADCVAAPPLIEGGSAFFTNVRVSTAGVSVYSNLTYQYNYVHDLKNGAFGLNSTQNVIIDHGQFSRFGWTAATHGNPVDLGNQMMRAIATGISESGTTVTLTFATAQPVPLGLPIAIYGASPAEYNGNFTVTGVSGNSVTLINQMGGLPPASAVGNVTFGYVENNTTISNNSWLDACGTSVITSHVGAVSNLFIYGNTFAQASLNESFDGLLLGRCNGNGEIGDLGDNGFGAVTTNALIYNNTFVNVSSTGVTGVQYSNHQSSGIDQQNNLVWDAEAFQFADKVTSNGTSYTVASHSYNTIINSSIQPAFSCTAVPTDNCINASDSTGAAIASASSIAGAVVTLDTVSDIPGYASGDPLIVIGSDYSYNGTVANPGPGWNFNAGMDTVYGPGGFPSSTGTATHAVYANGLISQWSLPSGTISNGHGIVLDANASGAAMPFISLTAPFNLQLTSDRLNANVGNGNNTSFLLPGNNVDANNVPRGANGSWDRGAYQMATQAGGSNGGSSSGNGSGGSGGGGGSNWYPTGGSSGLAFLPVTPCRLADTRNPSGPFGGPSLEAGQTRTFVPSAGECSIPQIAQAYSINVTAVPHHILGYLTVWPTGQIQPYVSTLNSWDGRIKANAVIVPAGNLGAISVYATDDTDVVLDITGYFASAPSIPSNATGLEFYAMIPCRVFDSRNPNGSLGGPSFAATEAREIPVFQSACNVPTTAQAYATNVTAIPKTGVLGFLTTWPTGVAQPYVSTLNAETGVTTANAAIIPAGANGSISIFVTDPSDVIIDINGYFAPPASGGLSLHNLPPCRVLDTRDSNGSQPFTGMLSPTLNPACAVPNTAQALVLSATVVPPAVLGYLTLWGAGQPQPYVSTLNSWDASVTSNMAIVPATAGNINAYASQATQLILDVSGYFAP